MISLYLLTFISLATALAPGYAALNEHIPVRVLYYQYFLRKPITGLILALSATAVVVNPALDLRVAGLSLCLNALAALFAFNVHQETLFPAVDFPEMTDDLDGLPIDNQAQIALIDYGGELRAYPLDYVKHHHIVNDRFGERLVALTYCAMCRSIIPFDVSDIGPLFVGSFKNANMVMADRRTHTFFQQSTMASLIGALHPRELEMIFFSILPFSEVKALNPRPLMAKVTAKDMRPFSLFFPGFWEMIESSNFTPGLFQSSRDSSQPPRTRVIGVYARSDQPARHLLKSTITEAGLLHAPEAGLIFVATGEAINAYEDQLNGQALALTLTDGELVDASGDRTWDLRGHPVGQTVDNLLPVAISDEYWFSWRKWHPKSVGPT